MAWWFTIYCRKPVGHWTAADIERGIREADYHTLAEAYEIEDDDLVDAALDALAVVAVSDKPLDLELRYRKGRPVVVHLWNEPAQVAEELDEARENRDPPASIAARLAETKEIVALELGSSNLADMGIVFAAELADFFAARGEGVVVDDDNNWSQLVDGRLAPVEE